MDILTSILLKHNIKESFINAKKMDKENRIFISDNFVVKIYYPKKFQYYYNELEVYKNLSNKDYLANLHGYGEEEGYKYIIISRLKGKSLFDSWDSYDVTQRKDFIKQISTILKDINNIRNEEVNFKDHLNNIFNSTFNSLEFSKNFLEYIKETYLELLTCISDIEDANLIHIDTHFYNFFVNDGKIFAYDFENTIMAPLDYQLLRWYRMWRYPESFYYPKNSLTQEQIDSYNILMPELLNNYESLYKNKNYNERVKLYSLIYLLQEANRCNLPEEKVKKYIRENKDIRLRG